MPSTTAKGVRRETGGGALTSLPSIVLQRQPRAHLVHHASLSTKNVYPCCRTDARVCCITGNALAAIRRLRRGSSLGSLRTDEPVTESGARRFIYAV